jgi:phage tail-like protein
MSDTLAARPFTAFNFAVSITPAGSAAPLCNAAFAECDGLEMSFEVRTLKEGGNNGTQVKLVGPVSYGQLTLRRGMTSAVDLWTWFESTLHDPSLRADTLIETCAADGHVQARFVLTRCFPLKLKAPPLNAKDGLVAIEELQVGYESLRLDTSAGGKNG